MRKLVQNSERFRSRMTGDFLCNPARPNRRGVVVVMVAVVSVLLLSMLAFTVDVPYMQLVRTELRIATDAAAKAGAEALNRTQKADKAIDTAIDVAAMNTVAGKKLRLDREDITLGRCARQPNGSCSFTAGLQPYNSVRVVSHLDRKSKNGPVSLFFGSVMGLSAFQPHQEATAGQTMQEICLVLDRSHSMAFDMSGVSWQYPKGTKSPPYDQPPHPSGSRWAALRDAVKEYTDIVGKQKRPPRVGLVTWGSEMMTNPPFPASIIDSPLTTQMSKIMTPLQGRGNKVMWGATNMAAGIDAGVQVLTAIDVNPLADKTMILMSDGVWNQGRDPLLAANDAKKAGVVIHSICLLSGPSEAVCREIATITGGTYTYAGNAAELTAAFEKLARQMMATLIE